MLKGGNDGDDGSTPHSDPEAEFDTGTFCHVDPNVCIAEGTTCYYFQSNPEGNTVSFDSVGGAFMPLLQAVTFDTWTDPMFDVMGAYNFWAWPYFIIVAIIGGMFVVNLFLAVIFDEFMRAQESASAEKEVSAGVKADEIPQPDGGHQADVEVALIATTAERSDHLSGVAQLSSSSTHNEGGGCCDCTPQHGYRARLRDIMLSACLNNISTGFVIFNLFVMCLPYAGQPAAWEATVEFLGEFVTWVFIIEMFFKLIGLGCMQGRENSLHPSSAMRVFIGSLGSEQVHSLTRVCLLFDCPTCAGVRATGQTDGTCLTASSSASRLVRCSLQYCSPTQASTSRSCACCGCFGCLGYSKHGLDCTRL